MMTNRRTAFILNSGKYQEIPATEVIEGQKYKPPYNGTIFRKYDYLFVLIKVIFAYVL